MTTKNILLASLIVGLSAVFFFVLAWLIYNDPGEAVKMVLLIVLSFVIAHLWPR